MAAEETVNAQVETAKGLWQTFNLKEWTQEIAGNSAQALEAAIYFVASFVAGFLFKKYFKIIVISLVVTALVLKFMEYNAFVTIHWDAMRTFVGLEPTADFSKIFNIGIEWVKNNVLLFIAGLVGFLIGFKLG